MTHEGFLLPHKASLLDTDVIALQLQRTEPAHASVKQAKLGKLLKYLQIPHHQAIMHDGGNDSHLMMRTLLVRAVQSLQRDGLSEQDEDICRKLEAIARAPLMSHERFEKALFSQSTDYGNPKWIYEALANPQDTRREGNSDARIQASVLSPPTLDPTASNML